MIEASKFDAVSFDVYGTILNWEPEIAAFLQSWLRPRGIQCADVELLARYDQMRRPIQDLRPILRYSEVLARTIDAVAQHFDVPLEAEMRRKFSDIAATHLPFPDSAPALIRLRQKGLKLAALSNVDDDAFARVTAAAGIEFDVVVTAQRVGAYKPDRAHFWAALADLRAMGIPKDRVLHVAQSRRADIVVANDLGLTSVWVNRPGHVFGREGDGAECARPDYEVESLAELVSLFVTESD